MPATRSTVRDLAEGSHWASIAFSRPRSAVRISREPECLLRTSTRCPRVPRVLLAHLRQPQRPCPRIVVRSFDTTCAPFARESTGCARSMESASGGKAINHSPEWVIANGCSSSGGTRRRFGGVARGGPEHSDVPQSRPTRRTRAFPSRRAPRVASAGPIRPTPSRHR